MTGATPLPGYLALVNLASGASVGSANLLLVNAGDDKTFTVALPSIYRYLDISVTPVVQLEYDEVQTVTITGVPTGGTFTLTFGVNTTTGIAYNASAATVQAALVALASIGANNVVVTGVAGGPYTVEFTGTLGFANQASMTASGAGLTGGTSPSVVIAILQNGQGWTTASTTTYTVRAATAQVVMTTPLLGATVNCRLSTFNYFTYTSIAQATDITFHPTTAMLDTTVLQGASGAGWSTFIPGLSGGDFACKTWELASGATIFLADLTSRNLLIVSFVAPDGSHAFEGSCYLSASNIQSSVSTLAAEDLTFKLTGIATLV